MSLIGFCSYAKQKLIGLHPNIMVQRSPSHFQTGTFYWAHVSRAVGCSYVATDVVQLQHEKLCVIDEAIAFMGGIDLCFGRWDTPQHVLVDEPSQLAGDVIWPGESHRYQANAFFNNQ